MPGMGDASHTMSGYTLRFVITPDPVHGLALIEELARHGCRISHQPRDDVPASSRTRIEGVPTCSRRCDGAGGCEASRRRTRRWRFWAEFGQDGAVAVTPATAAPSPR